MRSDPAAALATLGAAEQPVLLRLPISHYCRKAEWGLSHTGIPYRILDVKLRDMAEVRRANPDERTVPVLATATGLVAGSNAILRWADGHRAPEAMPLYPKHKEPDVAAWEATMDRDAGPAVRREAYRALIETPHVYAESPLDRLRLRLLRPTFRRIMAFYEMDRYRDDQNGLRLIVERVSERLARNGESGFLYGEHLTAADVTTAALLDPLVRIGDARGLSSTAGWDPFVQYVRRVRPNRLTRVTKRPIREADWRALESLAQGRAVRTSPSA